MSYQRKVKDRQKALRARYGDLGSDPAPRTYHRVNERTGGPMRSKKDYRRKPKHKGRHHEE